MCSRVSRSHRIRALLSDQLPHPKVPAMSFRYTMCGTNVSSVHCSAPPVQAAIDAEMEGK